MTNFYEPNSDNFSDSNIKVQFIYQVSKILTKDTPDKTQRIVARVFTVTFSDHTFEFMPDEQRKVKIIRLSWKVGDNSPLYLVDNVSREDDDDLPRKAYDMVIDKAKELDKDEYPVVRRRRRRSMHID